jgi:phosphatidylglycerol:prolipoprotein diacylglycerol transferase
VHPFIHFFFLNIPSYYLMISIGTILGLHWFLKRTPENEEGVALNIAFTALIFGFLGARLMHVFFEAPDYYHEHPQAIFYIWQGGFVYYGGLIVGMIAALAYLNAKSISWTTWADRASLPIGLTYAIGRIGCFLNGCCYGKYCLLPWAVQFPAHAQWQIAIEPRHPTQLYAFFFEIASLGVLLLISHRNWFRQPGRLFALWLITHAAGRILMECYRDDDRGPFVFGVSISTLISFVLISFGAMELVRRSQSRG